MNDIDLIDILGIYRKEQFELVNKMNAREFHYFIESILEKHGDLEREVPVKNRGDGRSGRIDLVFTYKGIKYPIELDRKSARYKSIYKIREYSKNGGFVITRDPFSVIHYF